jgi:vacuolar-type H+-ATPase subunit E/Vma4
LIIKNALNGKGSLSLSKKDLERLPENFEGKINSQLSDGKSIEISGNAASFDGGFVVEYPEMRIDCTFESLLNDKIDEVRDELSKILFA